MSIFHRLEVVGCGNETQIQVDENLNHLKRHNQAKIIKKSVILFLASQYDHYAVNMSID